MVTGSVHHPPPKVGTGRFLLLHSPVELRSGDRRHRRHLFLLDMSSDLLLISNPKYEKNFKIKSKIPLVSLWTAHCTDKAGKASRASKRSFILGWPTVNFVATFSSSELKEKWHSFIQRYINIAKDKEQPKRLSIKIFTEDIKNCAPSITITVKNSDTANDIINESLAVLGITGSERDYQLCVNSGKGEGPHLLIGHEHPYGIQKSHLTGTALLPLEPEDPTSASTLAPRELHGQIIQKPSCPARNLEQRVSRQQTEKRGCLMECLFHRGPHTGQDGRDTASPPDQPREVIGAPLTHVFDNEKLPSPILEMLSVISQKGLITKGIFKKSANKKSCRILKEKLNAGDKVNLEDKSVHVVASVLKDFLCNIPGSVFPSSAYVQWLSVPDEGNSEERIAAAQRLLEQLQKANDALLRPMFWMLHNIQQNSAANQMTVYNLSLCIAPSILSPPTSCSSSELDKDLTKKISLVQFLIENCPRIFAEDTTLVLEDSSISCDNSEEATSTTQGGIGTGHGRPEGTQKSHLKATALLPPEPKIPTSTATPGSQVLPSPFILNPICTARKEQQTGYRTDERGSQPDENVHCGLSSGQDTWGPSPPPAKPRQLFGATLTDVCSDHKLPTPVQAGLSFINEKGSLTEGIFRKPDNWKSCRTLKDKLNAGDKVNLDEESVHVVASVLKDFLRNIPGSAFPSSAYVQWLSVPDEGNSEERIAAAQRLLERLPKANDALLRALFRMLHNIQGSEVEDQIQKISLVQFLIENCPRIFAEDTTPVLEDSSISCDHSEEAAGTGTSRTAPPAFQSSDLDRNFTSSSAENPSTSITT